MPRFKILGVACLLSLASCQGGENKPAAPSARRLVTEPEPPPAPKPSGVPSFSVTASGPQVGWSTIPLDQKNGAEKLAKEVASVAEHVKDKELSLAIDRSAKIGWVTEFLNVLTKTGATGFVVQTKTRDEFPQSLKLGAVSQVSSPRPCAVVGKVLAERKNAVWALRGGTAIRSPKGLGGPDLTMTVQNLERAAGACKGSEYFFFSADEDVEWGLAYDLAASSQTVEGKPFTKVVLLPAIPQAGRAVELR